MNVNVRLIMNDKGGKQHCLSFVGSNLGVEKERTSEKDALK